MSRPLRHAARRRRAALTAGALLAALQAGTAIAATPGSAVHCAPVPGAAAGSEGPVLLTLRAPEAARATLSREGRDVLLGFPRPLPSFDAGLVLDCAPGLLEGASTGYDTLLLRLAPGTGLERREGGPGELRLELRGGVAVPAVATAASGEPPEARAGDLRLRLLDAQLLAETGQLSEARERFETLRLDMAASPEPLSGAAGVALRTGRWRQALALYQEALLLDPGNPAIAAAIEGIQRSAGPRLRTEYEFRETDGGVGIGRATANILGVSGQQPVGDGWRIGFLLDAAAVDAEQILRRDGSVGSFSGWRERGEIYLQHDDAGTGRVLVGSVFLNGQSVGAGLRAEFPDDSGVTSLRGEYRRPYWEFFQALIDYGTRDRVAIGRRQIFTTDLTGRIEVGANRYGVRGDDDVASTISVAGELRLGNLFGVRGLSTAYVFDGEYVLEQDERTGTNGTAFAPLSLVDREVHALVVGYAGARGSNRAGGLFTYELQAGYGVDRYGNSGPLVAANLGYVRGSLEFRLRGSYVENIGRGRGTSTLLGASLTWYF